jgi:propanol-preferring alcohol dehydrogenase
MNDGKTMRALQLVANQKPFEFRDLPIPLAGPGDVVIKVGGSGACASDLHVMDVSSKIMVSLR